MKPTDKHLIVVLGMHRSGTSALTRGLTVLGVELGANLMPPSPTQNLKGFWEDEEVVALNDEVLTALGREWHSPGRMSADEIAGVIAWSYRGRLAEMLGRKLDAHDVLGVKDPRFARMLPLCRETFDTAPYRVSYVVACRNPLSVAESLAARNGFSHARSHALWFEHVLTCLLDTRGPARLVVDFDRLIDAPQRELARIAGRLGLPFDAGSGAFRDYREEFLEEGLRHTRYDNTDLARDAGIAPEVVELHRILLDLSADRLDFEAPGLVERLNRLQNAATVGSAASGAPSTCAPETRKPVA